MNEEFLEPGKFVDSDAPTVIAFAREAAGADGSEHDRVLRLYYAIRDGIIYDPYVDTRRPEAFRASSVLALKRGFCCGKSSLLAAGARVIGVPARVGYADVRNHMTSPKLYERLKTDVFIWHSYTDLFLDGKWVKATPAFNAALCERVGLKPLDFDGRNDSLFHEFDKVGKRHMEYLKDHGPFADVPFDRIVAEFRAFYPTWGGETVSGDFQKEAVAGA